MVQSIPHDPGVLGKGPSGPVRYIRGTFGPVSCMDSTTANPHTHLTPYTCVCVCSCLSFVPRCSSGCFPPLLTGNVVPRRGWTRGFPSHNSDHTVWDHTFCLARVECKSVLSQAPLPFCLKPCHYVSCSYLQGLACLFGARRVPENS